MVRLLRRHVLSIACFCLAGATGLAAIADHRWKQDRVNRAHVADWYCANRGLFCGGASAHVIERRWNHRQLGYEAAVIAFGGFAIVRFAYRSARR
jgi:hypothetical protein